MENLFLANSGKRYFDPFYTTKADGNGIGLWITRRLTDALGGSVMVLEDDQNMTEFEIVLPVNVVERT